jgi:hypothetical protein
MKLSAGRHRDPEHGLCVIELASMLAGGRLAITRRAYVR